MVKKVISKEEALKIERTLLCWAEPYQKFAEDHGLNVSIYATPDGYIDLNIADPDFHRGEGELVHYTRHADGYGIIDLMGNGPTTQRLATHEAKDIIYHENEGYQE